MNRKIKLISNCKMFCLAIIAYSLCCIQFAFGKDLKKLDLLELRNVISKNDTDIKLVLLDSIVKQPSKTKLLVKNLRAIDLELGNYIDTASYLLNLLKSNYKEGNAINEIDELNNLIHKSNLYFTTPLGVASSDYVYKGILNDRSFRNIFNQKKLEYLSKYFAEDDNIKNKLSLLVNLGSSQYDSETVKMIRILLLEITKLELHDRIELHTLILDALTYISKNKDLYQSSQLVFISVILDLIENNNQVAFKDVTSRFSKIYPKAVAKYGNLSKSNSKSIIPKDRKETSLFSKSLNKNDKAGFPFGVVILLSLLSAAAYYFYKIRNRVEVEPIQTKNQVEPKFDELLDLAV